MECSLEFENRIGPTARPCRDDFTLLFEDVFFRIVPASVFICCCAIHFLRLRGQSRTAQCGKLHLAKISTTAVYAVLRLVLLIEISLETTRPSSAGIASAAVSFVAAVGLIILSHFEDLHSHRPSFLIALYLSITTLFEIVIVRTLWYIGGTNSIFCVSVAAPLVQVLLVALGSPSKKFEPRSEPRSFEEVASLPNRTLIAWLWELLWRGYRKELTPEDTAPVDRILNSASLRKRFAHIINGSPFGRGGLIRRTIQCLRFRALSPVIPRLCLTACTFAQPFLTRAIIKYIELGKSSPSINDSLSIIGACALVYTGSAIFTSWYRQMSYKAVTLCRGGLVESIFEKMLRLKEDKNSESQALTLMISDMQRLETSLVYVHELWAGVLETGLATWLLWIEVGAASFTVLGLSIVCTVVSSMIGKSASAKQQSWFSATEKRIAATSEMLSSLKAIKLTGSDQRVGPHIEDLRKSEFKSSAAFRTLLVGGVVSSYSTLTLAPVLVLGSYIGIARAQNSELDAAKLFTSLMLIVLLASPMMHILQAIPALGAARGSFIRIQKFLEMPERSDSRNLAVDSKEALTKIIENEKPTEVKTGEIRGDAMLSIQNVTLSWTEEPQLHNINLEVRSGEHVAILGATGSGKTLLLQGMLGNVNNSSGSIRIRDRRIGYCGQQVWLENMTAEQNVFRSCPPDDQWQRAIIAACALEDIVSSPNDLQTIGSGGVKLSGGQKQRLALARAIAFRPGLILLDDALSALDRSTRQRIIDRLFGESGILRQMRSTVIFATQENEVAQYADRIYRISEDGSFLQVPHERAAASQPKQVFDFSSQPEDKTSLDNITKEDDKAQVTVTEVSETEKKPATKVTDFAVYRSYLGSIGRLNLLTFLALSIVFAFTLRFPDIWVKWWSNASDETSARSTTFWLGVYASLSVLPLITLGLYVAHLLLVIVPASGTNLHLRLLEKVLKAPFTYISSVDTGDLMNRFNQDLMLVDVTLPLDLFNSAAEGLVCVMQTVLVCVASVYVLIALPFLMIVLWLVQHFYLRTSKQLRQLDLQSKAGLHTTFSETCTGLTTIRAHGWQHLIRKDFDKRLDRSQEPIWLLYVAQIWLQLVLNLIIAGLVVVVAGTSVALRDKISPGTIGLAFLNVTTLGETLTNFIISWTSLEVSLGAIARIEAFDKDTPTEIEPDKPVDVPTEWPHAGRIAFQGVWSSYQEDADNLTWAIRDFGMTIEAGEKVAICGHSGSGKSSLLLALLQVIKTKAGSIIIDGVDICQMRHSTLRTRIHVISQDAFNLGDTVRDSLDFNREFSDETIENAIRDCRIFDKVASCGGLSGKMQDLTLSSGEAQLFSLARVLLQSSIRPGGIILLDEATSSVDADTEKIIQNLIAERLQRKTIVSVLHSLETAMTYDKIAVMENGGLKHFGPPERVVHESELFSTSR